jgi:hypothetical protein
VDSKPFSACVYGGKNNNYFLNHFPLVFMAGKSTTICEFQTDFRTLFLAGRTAII